MKKVNLDLETLVVNPSIYKKSGKNVIVEFDKCFNTDKTNLNLFLITKSAYSKKLDEICRYANVFFKYYDQDKEFLTALLIVKYNIDNINIHYSVAMFMKDIAELLFTDSVISKIFKMVDDYYELDLTPNDDIKNIDMHALQFSNDHGKALMALAVAYKLTIPVVCHYYAIYSDKLSIINKARGIKNAMTIKDFLYNIFLSYFPLFQGDSNLYNKLVATAQTHINNTTNSDKVLWNRQKNKKNTPTIYTDKLVSAAVVDLLTKAIFKKNLIYLIQVALPFQIKQLLMGKDKFEYSDISTFAKADELSGLEKMEANSAKISDLDVVLSKLNIDKTIRKIQNKYNIDITKDEIEFYTDNLKDFKFSEIVLQFFSNYFSGFYDLKSINKRNYIRLLIIFKKIMSKMGFVYIHQIMTGNISKEIKRRKVSTKQLKKLESSKRFQKLMKSYSMGIEEDKNSIISVIALLINTPVQYVDYDHPEHLGEDINVDFDIIADEYMRFIKML